MREEPALDPSQQTPSVQALLVFPMTRNDSLDGMRGVAVLMVFLYHTLQKPAAGNLGVDIFFVLSGYLITTKLIEELDATGTVNIARFYVNRCLRLIPAFLLMCVLYEGLHHCFPSIVSFASPLSLLAFLFTSNYYWARGIQPFPVASHIWTLATKWQFYFVWPLVAAFALCRSQYRTAVAIVLCACAVAVMAAEFRGIPVPKFEGILIGCALAIGLSNAAGKALPFRTPGVSLGAIAGVVVFAFLAPKASETSSIIAISLAVVAIYAMAGSGACHAVPLLSGETLKYFGKISYGLYIYHFPVVAVAYVAGQRPLNMFLIALFVAVPLSDFSFRFVETPALKLRSVFRRKKSQRSDATV